MKKLCVNNYNYLIYSSLFTNLFLFFYTKKNEN